MGIESVGGQGQQVSQQMNVSAMPSSDVSQVQQIAAQVAPLISAMSNLCVQETQRTEEGEKTHETTNAPRLDEAELEAIAANCVDLEALIAELQAETDKVQVLVSKERIEGMKGELEAQNEQSLQKISESLDAIAEQQKQDKINSALGWLGVVMAAVTLVAAVFTGGAAAIALAAVGLALATTMQVLNETGAMEDIMQSLSDAIHELDKNNNLSSEAEDAIAAAIIAAIEIAISVVMLCCGQAASSAANKATKAGKAIGGLTNAAKSISQGTRNAIRIGTTVANAAMSVVGIGASAHSTVVNFEAGMAQADVTEMEAILKQLQELLDQESEDLQQILQSMNDSLAAVIELLGSKQDTLNAISMNIGA